MALNLGVLTAQVTADVSNYIKGMQSVSKEAKKFESQTKATSKTMEDFGPAIKAVETQAKIFGKSVNVNAEKAKLFKESIVKLTEEGFDENSLAVKRLTAEYNKYSQAAEKAAKHSRSISETLDNYGGKLKSFGTSLSVGVTLPIVAVGGGMLKMAMDAVESENLFEVSMGAMTAQARQFSETLRQELGLNAYEIRKNVGMLNTMLTSMGLTEQGAYDMSTSMTQLAYDMASFFNISPEQAFEKLRAGIVGESEPLKQLGIVVNETTSELWALNNGLISQGEKLTEQGKILARYGVIMEATKNAQGDLARTIESPTNQLRIMKEQVAQLSIEMGKTLIPTLLSVLKASAPLLEIIKDLADKFTKLSPEMQQNVIIAIALIAAIGPLAVAIGGLVTIIGALLSPVGLVIAALAAFAAGCLVIYNNITEGMAQTLPMLREWEAAFKQALDDLVAKAPEWGRNLVEGFIGGLRQGQGPIWAAAVALAQSAKDAITGKQGLDMHSPSKVMEEKGRLAGEGVAVGLGKSAKQVHKAAKTVTDEIQKVFDDFNKSMVGITSKKIIFGIDFDATAAQFQEVESSLNKLADLGVDPASESVQNLAAQWRELKAQINIEKAIKDVENIIKDTAEAMELAQKQAIVFGESFDFAGTMAGILEGEINALLKNGYKPLDETILKLRKDHKEYLAMVEKNKALKAATEGAKEFAKALRAIDIHAEVFGDFSNVKSDRVALYKKRVEDLKTALADLRAEGKADSEEFRNLERTLAETEVGLKKVEKAARSSSAGFEGLLTGLQSLGSGGANIASQLKGLADSWSIVQGGFSNVSKAFKSSGILGGIGSVLSLGGAVKSVFSTVKNLWSSFSGKKKVAAFYGSIAEQSEANRQAALENMQPYKDYAATIRDFSKNSLIEIRGLAEDSVGFLEKLDLVGTYELVSQRIRRYFKKKTYWAQLWSYSFDEAGADAAVAFLNRFTEIASGLSSSVSSAFSSSIKEFLSGKADWVATLKEGIKNAIIDAITTAVMQATIVKGALGDLLGELAAGLAAGIDVTEIVRQIGATIPIVAAQIEKILTPLKNTIVDTFNKTGSEASLEFMNRFNEISSGISSSINSAFSSSIKAFLSGKADWVATLKEGIKNAIIDAITTAVMEATIVKGALGGLLETLANQLAKGTDVTGTIQTIGAAIPTIAKQLQDILLPLRGAILSAFPGGIDPYQVPSTATNVIPPYYQIPAMATGGVVSRPTMALIGEAGPEAVVPLDRMGAMGGDQTIIIQLDGRTLTQTVVKNMPAVVKIKTGVSL